MSKSCAQLLTEFKQINAGQKFKTQQLIFKLTDNRDVYNITAPFKSAGKIVLAGRVEPRDSEHSEIMFFEEINGAWLPIAGAPIYQLQDPFFTQLDEQHLLVGGVEVFPDPVNSQHLAWRTVFMIGTDIFSLKRFNVGPDRMKDLRLTKLKDGRILVFTRPQGEIGGRGTIGFIILDSLTEFTHANIAKASLTKHFASDEWGGVNEIHQLKNGKIGVLAHVACFDAMNNRHYYPAAFSFDPITLDYSELKLLGYRALFQDGAAKRPDLQDVVFSGGLIRLGSGKARLYAGIADAEAHYLDIPDPFDEFECI